MFANSQFDFQLNGGTRLPLWLASLALLACSAEPPTGGAGGAGGTGPSNCIPTSGAGAADVLAVSVSSALGGAPRKGDAIDLTHEIDNKGPGVAEVVVTPYLDSQRFTEFSGIPLGSTRAPLCRGANRVTVRGGPFLTREDGKAQFAIGSGAYTVPRVRLAPTGQNTTTDSSFDGATFNVATSTALLVPVVYDARYFSQITGNPSTTPEDYLRAAFTRQNEIFTPSGSDPDGAGSYQTFPGGFDQMMNVRHVFRSFPGFPGESTTTEGWCEDAAAYARTVLGMGAAWNSQPAGTRPERHGFDYLIALTPDLGGGVTCGWLDVQVSSLINRDLARQHVIAVHETGHVFGAPHCDDVGNGSGGSLQGYVMCSGEKHPHYPTSFVWHSTSRARMSTHWN